MRERLSDSLKTAMKALEKRRVATLRLIHAAIKDRDIAAGGAGKDRISDAEIVEVLAKMIKQRRESIATYEQAGRTDLADQEKEEIVIIEEFMPRQLGPEETRAAVTAVVTELGAHGLKDMGKVMTALKQRHAGEIDFGKAGAIVKEILQ